MRLPVYLLICLAILITLISAASAVSEVVSLGPYKVSFDLNTTMEYSVQKEDPVKPENGSATYGLSVKGEGKLIYIYVTGNKELRVADYDGNRIIVQSFLEDVGCKNINITRETIDGHIAALGGGMQPSGAVIFAASYSPDGFSQSGAYVGRINCRLFSTYPLDETASLLRTVHVTFSGMG